MNFYTDLALERREYCKKEDLDGVIFTEREDTGIKITDVEIINAKGEQLLSKPIGKYITLESQRLFHKSRHSDIFTEVLSKELKKLIPQKGTVLVVGLGNEKITPDALGPKCLSQIFSTRHITEKLRKDIGLDELRSVCAFAPGVLGKTGIETSETVAGIAKKVNPSCIIAVDALASRNISRLGTTVQLSSSGIEPGSGVGNHRQPLSKDNLGIPVIAIGVPTVVDGGTMTVDILEKSGFPGPEDNVRREIEKNGTMFVTPKGIDELIDNCAGVIAMSINIALQPKISAEEIYELTL